MTRKKLADRLEGIGFTADDQTRDAYAAKRAEVPGAAHLHGAWRRGGVTVVVEENKTQGTPAVAVIEGPGGRVVVNADDLDTVEVEADNLSSKE